MRHKNQRNFIKMRVVESKAAASQNECRRRELVDLAAVGKGKAYSPQEIMFVDCIFSQLLMAYRRSKEIADKSLLWEGIKDIVLVAFAAYFTHSVAGNFFGNRMGEAAAVGVAAVGCALAFLDIKSEYEAQVRAQKFLSITMSGDIDGEEVVFETYAHAVAANLFLRFKNTISQLSADEGGVKKFAFFLATAITIRMMEENFIEIHDPVERLVRCALLSEGHSLFGCKGFKSRLTTSADLKSKWSEKKQKFTIEGIICRSPLCLEDRERKERILFIRDGKLKKQDRSDKYMVQYVYSEQEAFSRGYCKKSCEKLFDGLPASLTTSPIIEMPVVAEAKLTIVSNDAKAIAALRASEKMRLQQMIINQVLVEECVFKAKGLSPN